MIFCPSGDSSGNRFVATSLPMTQTGRPPSASAAVMKPALRHVEAAGGQKLVRRADDLHAAELRVLVYTTGCIVPTTGATAAAMVICRSTCAACRPA